MSSSFDCEKWEKKTRNIWYFLLIAIIVTVPSLGYATYLTVDTNIEITIDTSKINFAPAENKSILVYGDYGNPDPAALRLYAGANNASFFAFSIGCYLVTKNSQFLIENEGMITQFASHKWLETPQFLAKVHDIETANRISIANFEKRIDRNQTINTFSFHISSDYLMVITMRVGCQFNASLPPELTSFIFSNQFYYIQGHKTQNILTGEYTGNTLFGLPKGYTDRFTINAIVYDYDLLPTFYTFQSDYQWYNGHTNNTCAFPFLMDGNFTQTINPF